MSKHTNRTIEKEVKKLIDKCPVIMITGPRQVGKTTLLNYIISLSHSKVTSVSLDDILLRKQANEDPELFLRTYEAPLMIDEFQYAPNLLSYIKMNVDEMRKEVMFHGKKDPGTLYYLTGSQIFETMQEVSESLAGRVGILDLYGFSTREINGLEEDVFIPDIKMLKKKEKVKNYTTNQLFERIIRGSYPEVVLGKRDKDEYFENYIRTYLERDVRKLIHVDNEIKFIKFLSSVAARTGMEYNALDIAKDVEIDSKTCDAWLSILKNTHLVYLLPSYSNNNIQKAIKRPKLYFLDTGLACYLTGYLNASTLEKSVYSGQIFETYVIGEIIKSFTNHGIDPKKRLYYYRDKNMKEIDLLILHDNKIYPIEIKKSANPGNHAIKNFDVLEKFGMDIGNGIVLCMKKDIVAIDENNYIVPIEYI